MAEKIRKGARRRSEVPVAVVEDLNAGRTESVNLVEWLSVDMEKLARAALTELGLESLIVRVTQAARAVRDEGVTVRMKSIGEALWLAVAGRKNARQTLDAISRHGSDMMRSWAAYAFGADPSIDLAERLQRARRFAADDHMGVRESAWDSFRPWLALELERGIELLVPWVKDADENVRRCASEATRPRGVWCKHIEALKTDPSLGLPLLQPLRADPSPYVQRSVANWLNDASKSDPEWTETLCRKWLKQSKSPHTAWIVNHAQRTLRKKDALADA